MSLASATVAQQKHVLLVCDKLAARQVQQQRLVGRGNGQEVEAIQTLDHRELRLHPTDEDLSVGWHLAATQLLAAHVVLDDGVAARETMFFF
jgi:hypothetical protein